MLQIYKLPEPTCLRDYKSKRGSKATYDGFKGWRKKENPRPFTDLRKQLIAEQGFVCAYCGQRLADEPENAAGDRLMAVEHYIPQRGVHCNTSLALDYENLLAVCRGGGDRIGENHCDQKKDDDLLVQISNPAKDTAWANTLTYLVNYRNEEASIFSSDNSIQIEINEKLNLNAQALRKMRFAAYKDMREKAGYLPAPPLSEIARQFHEIYANRAPNERREDFEHFRAWQMKEWLRGAR